MKVSFSLTFLKIFYLVALYVIVLLMLCNFFSSRNHLTQKIMNPPLPIYSSVQYNCYFSVCAVTAKKVDRHLIYTDTN